MTPFLLRAQQLFAMHRYDLAVEAFRQHLLLEPNDGLAHAQLAISLSELDELQAATEHARQAVGLDPDESLPHFALAIVLRTRNHHTEALEAINQAIRIDPQDPDLFGFRAALFIDGSRWQESLDDADRGLAIDADHDNCGNMRAVALVRLGRKAEAADSLGAALARDPDNAYTHANQGWTLLERRDPKRAMEHFREALRIDPELAWARAGIIEAMKARNFVYRVFLGYLFWMESWPPNVRWAIVLGGLFAQRIVAELSHTFPAAAPVLTVVFWLYVAFALLTWLAYPCFNLLLFTSRFGRLAMTPDQRRGALTFGTVLVTAIGLLTWAIQANDEPLVTTAVRTFLLAIPATSIFVCPSGWPRWTMAAATLLLAGLIGLEYSGTIQIGIDRFAQTPAATTARRFLSLGLIGSQFLANYLVGVRVRK